MTPNCAQCGLSAYGGGPPLFTVAIHEGDPYRLTVQVRCANCKPYEPHTVLGLAFDMEMVLAGAQP